MDGKAQLRRYLEQRRELGESEFVLDGVSVEEALLTLGALKGRRGGAASTGRNAESRSESRSESRPATVRPAVPPRDVALPPANQLSQSAPSLPSGTSAASTSAANTTEHADAPPSAASTEQSLPTRAEGSSAVPGEPATPSTQRAAASGHRAEGSVGAKKRAPDGLVVGSANASLFANNPFAHCASLQEIAAEVDKCRRCDLYKTATHGVPGEGNPSAGMMCVGEAPGANEDATGRPFVGAAGQLMDKILAAINIARQDVFIANVLKHRPPGNRNPKPEEVEACSPYLIRQIELVRPKVIIAWGTFAAQTLLDTKTPIGKLRGMVHRYYGVPLIVTYHPAALLRNPAWKRPTWEDVQLARQVLDDATAA